MNLPSIEMITEDLARNFGIDGVTADDLAEYIIGIVDDHREFSDWERVVIFYKLWKEGLPDWAEGNYVRVCARLCGWDYNRSHLAFMAAAAMNQIDFPEEPGLSGKEA